MGYEGKSRRFFLAPFRGVRSLEPFLACGKGGIGHGTSLPWFLIFWKRLSCYPFLSPRELPVRISLRRREARLARIRRNGALEF
jgi:hypothetical protein